MKIYYTPFHINFKLTRNFTNTIFIFIIIHIAPGKRFLINMSFDVFENGLNVCLQVQQVKVFSLTATYNCINSSSVKYRKVFLFSKSNSPKVLPIGGLICI